MTDYYREMIRFYEERIRSMKDWQEFFNECVVQLASISENDIKRINTFCEKSIESYSICIINDKNSLSKLNKENIA